MNNAFLEYDELLKTEREYWLKKLPKYGYGWLIDDFGGHTLTAHGGGAPGYVSVIQRWLDDSVCVIVLCNNGNVKAHAVANGLAAIALNPSSKILLMIRIVILK